MSEATPNGTTRAVIAFDLYGTLLSTASIAKQLAVHFGDEKADSIAKLWRQYQLQYTWRLNCMRQYQDFSTVTQHSLEHALLEHGLSLSEDATEQIMQAYDSLATFPDVKTTLDQLTNVPNLECYVFTNGTRTMATNSVLKSVELGPHSDLFKGIITVDVVRSFKPAPEVYRYLAARTGMEQRLDRLWLVSGNPFDVVGARAVGMSAVWLDRTGSGWQDRLAGKPTVVIKTLEELMNATDDFGTRSK